MNRYLAAFFVCFSVLLLFVVSFFLFFFSLLDVCFPLSPFSFSNSLLFLLRLIVAMAIFAVSAHVVCGQ